MLQHLRPDLVSCRFRRRIPELDSREVSTSNPEAETILTGLFSSRPESDIRENPACQTEWAGSQWWCRWDIFLKIWGMETPVRKFIRKWCLLGMEARFVVLKTYLGYIAKGNLFSFLDAWRLPASNEFEHCQPERARYQWLFRCKSPMRARYHCYKVQVQKKIQEKDQNSGSTRSTKHKSSDGTTLHEWKQAPERSILLSNGIISYVAERTHVCQRCPRFRHG